MEKRTHEIIRVDGERLCSILKSHGYSTSRICGEIGRSPSYFTKIRAKNEIGKATYLAIQHVTNLDLSACEIHEADEFRGNGGTMMPRKWEYGQLVRDKLTGVSGIVTATSQYFGERPAEVRLENPYGKTHWFPEGRLEVIENTGE